MTAAERSARTEEADALSARAYADAGCPESRVALVAIGGYGRAELAPYSDLDVLLVLDDEVEAGEWAGQVWYPLWDSGARLDHAVRTFSEVIEQASADLRVMLGLLDLRHLAGDPNLTLRLRTTVLAQWRRDARGRLPELRTLAHKRGDLLGPLAHAAIPDLKESAGGLRDATVLRALVASWLVDVPHVALETARTGLLDLRDVLHQVAGRATDRVVPEYWPDIAASWSGHADEVAAQQHARALGRRIQHLSRLTWRRAEETLARSPGSAPRRPKLQPVAPGVAVSRGEVVLDTGARLSDPLLLLRAAAEAAERDLLLSPATVARLVREGAPLPTPWPAEARELFVRLLAAGRGLEGVWETLDETDAIATFLPEWERIRLLPHASAVHRFTVDRHLVECCIEAAALIRTVSRPDLLVVAALLHDIGKGGLVEHSVAGEPVAREIAARIGFEPADVEVIGQLVRWHLLLPEVATTRDPDDPATAASITAKVEDPMVLELLGVLTEADARATSEKAWTRWRAGLIRTVHARATALLAAGEAPPAATSPTLPVPDSVRAQPGTVSVEVEQTPDGAQVTVIARDRVGLLADAAAMLALQRVSVRAARVWTEDGYAFSVWQVADEHLDAAVLRQRLEGIVSGRINAGGRLSRPVEVKLEPTVAVRGGASASATVIEVRTEDRPGVIYTVCRALAALDITVDSAHVATLGPQAVDVFYVREEAAATLSDERAALAAHAIRDALMATVK